MKELHRWLAGRARAHARRLSIEAALLGGGYLRYAFGRLWPFLTVRLAATVAHVVEFTILLQIFAQRGLVTSLALSNGALLVGAFYWGALEEMRRKLRQASPGFVRDEVRLWVSRALKLGLAAIALAAAIALGRWRRGDELGALDGYALVIAIRLALDLLLGSYHSGVYAQRRVYRNLWLVVAVEPLGILAVAFGWRHLGEWSFPAGLLVATLASHAVAFHYTIRAYRVMRVPLPAPSLRAPRNHPPTRLGEALWAGAANLSTRLGSALVLGGLLRVGLHSRHLDAFTFALQLTSPLFAGAAGWGRVFYHEWKRLGDELHGALRRRLDRRLPATALAVGLSLWGLAVGLAALIIQWRFIRLQMMSLLPLFLTTSYLAALQLRGFALGEFRKVTLGSLLLCAATALAVVMGGPADPSAWNLILAAAVALSALAVAFLSAPRPPATLGVLASPHAWARALAGVNAPVSVARAQLASGVGPTAATAKVATRLASALGSAVAVDPQRRRIFWFARDRPSGSLLVGASGGTLGELRAVAAADGRTALKAAREAGLLGPPAGADPAGSLVAEFRRLFPDGHCVDLTSPRDRLDRLAPAERRLVWSDALRCAREGARRSSSGFEVTAFHACGEIRLVFVTARKPHDPARLAWRRRVEAESWRLL